MNNSTTKILAGDWNAWWSAHEFCTEHFGKGGVQKGKRWFARIVTPVTIEVYQDKSWGSTMTRHNRRKVGEEYTMIYFRDPADAVWFNLKFGVSE